MGVFFAILIALCAIGWSVLGLKWKRGWVLPLTARRRVPWNGADLLMIAALFVLLALTFRQAWKSFMPVKESNGGHTPSLAAPEMSAGQDSLMLAGSMAVNIGTAAFAFFWIRARTHATAEDFGWRRDTVGYDLGLGLTAFAAVAAPVYGITALVSRFSEQQHPIIDALRRHPTGWLYLSAGLSAVVVAPLAEEFFFRVLLQGWLESLSGHALTAGQEPVDAQERARPGTIAISSFLFAACHLEQGTSPIPLFVFALALGFLYQRTHRLLPSVTLHFCLNACSFVSLVALPADG